MIGRLALGVLLLGSMVPPHAAALPATGVRLQGTITHTGGGYLGRLSGVLAVDIVGSQAVLPLAGGSCLLTVSWALASASDGRATRAVEVCFANATTTAAALDAFLAGQTSGGDPSLAFPLVTGPTPGVLINPATVGAQMFVRGCSGATYRKLADLVVAPGGLLVRPFLDADGAPQVELLPSTATLGTADAALWADVLALCRGNDRMLPATPSPGATSDLAGTSVLPPLPPGPHQDIGQLMREVDDLVAGGVLGPFATSLTRPLGKAAEKLRAGQAKRAIRKMGQFVRRAGALVRRSVLPAAEGQLLIDGGTAVQASIGMLAFSGPVRNLPAGCPVPAPCAPALYDVRPGGGGAGTFATIAAALAEAETDGACGVELQVANGRYADDLVVTRPTAIFGASRNGVVLDGVTILNSGPHELNLARLVFDGSSILGAVVVDDTCATTTIADVRIEGAQRWGVWQQGGTLEVVGLTVSDTQATGGDPARGTGIYLTGGVEATLVSVDLLRNESSGLALVGTGTDVSAHDVEVEATTVNPFYRDDIVAGLEIGGAGVAVLAGAVLDMQSSRLSRNEYFGLFVDDGATARFEHGTVEDTRVVGDFGGFNVIAARGASLDLVDFFSLDAALAGIAVVNSEVDASDGEVSGCVIGAYVNSEDFDLARIQAGVVYRDNDLSLEATALPLPLPGTLEGF